MPKMDGEKTKKKILQVAEGLFSEKGFNGASISMIAKAAGVNKALIYYHFRDKNDLIVSLFRSIVQELADYVDHSFSSVDPQDQEIDIIEKIKGEIQFLEKRKGILSVLLMESLKTRDKNNFLFKCSEIVINHEFEGFMKKMKAQKKARFPEKQQYLVYEFFTGVLPLVAFVALKDKWCEYFKCDEDKLLEYFLDSFEKSHIAFHGTEDV